MEQLDFYGAKVQELYQYLEASLFEIICRNLRRQLEKLGPDSDVSIPAWQIDALADIGQLNEDAIAKIAEVSGLTPDVVRQAVYSVGYDTIKEVDDRLTHRERPPIPAALQQRLDALVNQAVLNLDNLINQTLLTSNGVVGVYQDIISRAAAEASIGLTTLDQAVSRTVNEWLEKGIQSGFVDKGGRTWSIENYAKTAINSTINNAYRQGTQDRMADYGLYTVLIGSHPQARPACSLIQGHVVDLRPMAALPPGWKYKSIYDPVWNAHYKEPGGHAGVNCHHPHLVFDPEYMTNNMTQYDPEEARRADEIEAGRKAIANRIRKSKKKLMAYEALGDPAKTGYYKKLLNKQRKAMVQYVKDNDLKREYSLERVITPESDV